MKQPRFQYGLSGYRWVPESFHVSKGLAGRSKAELHLSNEERRKVGYCFLTKGFREAVDQVKRIEHERAQKYRLYITYGFRTKEDDRLYVCCRRLRCKADAGIAERLRVFKAIRRNLKETGGKVEISAECEMDGHFKPVHVKRNMVTADYSYPLRIWLKSA